jgi:Cache domain
MTAHVPHLNQRVLTVFLLVSLPALIVGTALVLRIGQGRLGDSYGRHLQDVAQQAAAGIDAYVYRRILDVSLLARTPDLRSQATAGSTRPFDRAAAEAVDREWQQGAKPPRVVEESLGNAASRYLKDLVVHDHIYREMILTDRQGRLVAASNPTTDYFQGDEDWWIAAVDDGRQGRVSISDVRWDPSARVYALEISAPVPTSSDESLAGVLKVVTDSRELLALVGNLQPGQSGSAWLLRRNGTIVFNRQTANPNARFFASDTLQTHTGALRESGPIGGTHFSARAADGTKQIVAVAESQLGASYPSLPWLVAVSQGESELVAPLSMLGWYLLALVAFTALIVLGLALWFSVRLAATPVDVDMHLVRHPQVSHVGELAQEPPADTVRM